MEICKKKKSEFNAFDIVMSLMNQNDFRLLFDNHFNDFSEIKSILLIMKTYQYLENLYVKQHGVLPDKHYMTTGIHNLMANSEARKFLVESTLTFMADEKKFEKIIDDNLDKKIIFSNCYDELHNEEETQLKITEQING